MKGFLQSFNFPRQRVSDEEKNKPEWYANCIDWLISQGLAYADTKLIIDRYRILHGELNESDYNKVLNPYNFTDEKLKRFPATLRNYDIIKGTIRRYVSEYIQSPHDFIVSANNPEVVLSKNLKLKQELIKLAQHQISIEIQNKLKEWIDQGNNPQEFNAEEAIDVEQFIADFNENYIDNISAQGSDILNVIRDVTNDEILYAMLYFDFVTFGQCYTYSDVIGTSIVKRIVHPIDAYPIPNDNMFVEDFDAFCERRKLTYQQIVDEFDEYLTEKDKQYLDEYYGKSIVNSPYRELSYDTYNSFFMDICTKFTKEEIQKYKSKGNLMERDINGDLYDVWHVVWRGERKECVVTYVDESGFTSQRIEQGDYTKQENDIDVEYYYVPQVYEGVRIGTRETGIYPYKARAIAYNRNGKLPYNGACELLPGYGEFSIIDIMRPYQVLYNIVHYSREMAILKNKISQLVLPKSLLGTNPDATIHKMLADGVIYVDDEDDQGMVRSQQIRIVNASYGDYIKQLSELLQLIEDTAKDKVDMTPQRYGQIATSAGKGVTEEAILRGSMGSVIVEAVVDYVREKDYARDMDYSKLAWIDGLDTSYRDNENKMKYVSLDINSHIYADYVIKAKNSAKIREKLQQLKQFAFSAAQNGDSKMAIAAIVGDNIETIKKLISKYQDETRAFELQKQQNEQQIEQLKQQFDLQKVQMQGEIDMKKIELEGIIKKDIALIQADANMNSYNNEISLDTKEEAVNRLNKERAELDKQKLNLDRTKLALDAIDKAETRRLKEKDIDTKLKIAKTNKNKYDKK